MKLNRLYTPEGKLWARLGSDRKLYLDGAQMGSRGPVSEQECQQIWTLGIFAYIIYKRFTIIVFTLLKPHNINATLVKKLP